MGTVLPDSSNNSRARRYLCIYFPKWSIDVTRRKLAALNPAHTPATLLLTTTHMNQQVIARACQQSQSQGVREMMSLALAQALVPPDTYHEPFDALRDAYALRTLAVWCLRFSPIVGLDNELSQRLFTPSRHRELASLNSQHYGIAIDLTGTEKVNGDPQILCTKLHELFRNTARIAVAPSLGGAWALSRYAVNTPIIARSFTDLCAKVATLTVRALRIDNLTCDKLSDVGVYTIGDLSRFPSHTLGRRFGKGLLCRLAQLYGAASEQISVVAPALKYRECAIFEPPLSHRHAIFKALEHLFAKLIGRLSGAQIAASLFKISITDTENATIYKELSLAAATSDPAHLQAIVLPVIESMRFCGEVHKVAIEALETTRISPSQQTFHGEEAKGLESIDRAYRELLNSFSTRLGKARVIKAFFTASHIPERSFHYSSAIAASLSSKTHSHSLHESSPDYGAHNFSLHSLYTSPFDRPPLLLSPAEPINSIAMLPDKPPSWIRWRSARLSIISGFGPERIAPEWWQGDLNRSSFTERDYFTVQDESGRWLWVFRCLNTQAWFVHGIWT